MKQNIIVLIAVIGLGLISCSVPKNKSTKEIWGEINGEAIHLYTITNENGMVMKLTNYGGIITSVLVPDKNGNMVDVVLGYDNLQQYLDPNPCFGATIGRFANRIRNASFVINDSTYHLTQNDKVHCSHGGMEFNTAVWQSKEVQSKQGVGVQLKYLSKDGMHGFPGNLDVTVTYILSHNNAIEVTFEASTDKATHVSLTQHSYFNLNGGKSPIHDHLIKIDADNYTEIDADIVPTGVIGSVLGEEWDLTQMTRMGDHMHQLNHNGYHYCYVFNKTEGELKKVIEVIEPSTGITMDVSTTQPGVQFYSGNAINDQLIGKYGIKYGPHAGFCLETEHLPNTPNLPNFPSTLLLPEEQYKEIAIYDFGIKE
ncbi:aldose epimerase family protein [Labilibacter marinus]|uniref:aldose epimerase family protein n=1 Tax=Labilibacter marinus TaxID=1477105 RepID=UPI000950208D|nr:aldose epimerase family protein [Labilibacter marinus]